MNYITQVWNGMIAPRRMFYSSIALLTVGTYLNSNLAGALIMVGCGCAVAAVAETIAASS